MTKQMLDDLVEISFDGKTIHEDMVEKIAPKLKRNELKAYIRKLRAQIMKHTVTIITPTNIGSTTKKMLQDAFSGKMLSFETNPETILGSKIIDNDMVYDATLKGQFNQITNTISE